MEIGVRNAAVREIATAEVLMVLVFTFFRMNIFLSALNAVGKKK